MRHEGLVAGVGILICGLLWAGGCGKAPPGETFVIAWNYDTSGYLEPCGCSQHQLGGLARRASMIAELRKTRPVFAIEGARNLEEGGDFKLFKSEILVKALNSTRYNAIMLGIQEARFGVSGIRSISETAAFPAFSANLKVKNGDWLKPVVIDEIAGVRLAVTGVSQPELVDYDLPAGVTFDDPATSLTSVLTGLREKADVIVVCLEGRTDWIEMMIECVGDQADLFLTGDMREITMMSRSQILARLDFRRDPPVLNNLAQGRYLGLVTVKPKRGGYRFSGTNEPIEDTITDDPEVLDILTKDFKPRLVEYFAEFTGNLPKTYLPAKGCSDCHPEEYKAYAETGHYQAMETLKRGGQIFNPDCMGCHLAYNPDSDELEPLHCVSCHGNIVWDHAFKAEADMVEMPETPVTAYTYEWCLRCHDPENSLPFEKYWPQYVHQIYHGGDRSKAEAAAERMGLDITAVPPDFASTPRQD